MSTNEMRLQFLRGNTAENDAYTGRDGEITLDVEKNQYRVHDAVTPGGHVPTANFSQQTAGKIVKVPRNLDTPDYLPMDGSNYLKESYPELAELFPEGEFTEAGVVTTLPELPFGNGKGVEFSPDGTMVAFALSQTQIGLDAVHVLRTSDWSRVTAPLSEGKISHHGVKWSPDGRFLYVGYLADETGNAHSIYSTSDWTEIALNFTQSRQSSNVEFSLDSRYMILGTWADTQDQSCLTIVDTTTWSEVPGVESFPDASLWASTLNSTGDRYAFADNLNNELIVMSVPGWEVVQRIPLNVKLIWDQGHRVSVQFNNDGSELYLGLWNYQRIDVYDTQSWTIKKVIDLPFAPQFNMALSPNGRYLSICANGFPAFYTIDTVDWKIVSDTVKLAGTGWGVNYSHDGEILAIGYHRGKVDPGIVFIKRTPSTEIHLPKLGDGTVEDSLYEWRVKAG